MPGSCLWGQDWVHHVGLCGEEKHVLIKARAFYLA